jgi:hypothetical protein
MQLTYEPLDTALVRALRAGAPDANGMRAERHVAQGTGNPCRHCLDMVAEGRGLLILAHRPFPALQPYAEVGPIFLCADDCAAWRPGSDDALPPILRSSPDYLLKGYTRDHRIAYGTGRIVARDGIADYAARVLADPAIAFVDVRSARNNCFQLRIRRAQD